MPYAKRTKRETVGVDPKVPVQAITTVIVFLASYFAIDLDAELAGAIAVLLGTAAGFLAPAPDVVEVPADGTRDTASVARDALSS